VLSVVYLIFNAGYTAGPSAGRNLAEEAIWLGRMLDHLRPHDPEIEGILALLLASDQGGYISGTAINVDGGKSPVV
ncbi:MAG: DUF6596 domain-containing protein, partial [Alphaproteobacteria bacterium]